MFRSTVSVLSVILVGGKFLIFRLRVTFLTSVLKIGSVDLHVRPRKDSLQETLEYQDLRVRV